MSTTEKLVAETSEGAQEMADRTLELLAVLRVPVALLDLKDRNAVIRAQVPTAIPLLGANLILLGVLCFR